MKNPAIFFSILIMACGLHSCRCEGPVLMSYNVKNCEGADGLRLYSRIGGVISGCKPDAVAIQELDRCTRRVGGDDVISELAALTGMKASYAKAIDFGGGEYGVGILSLEEPLRTGSVPLPGREERRVLLMAEFKDYIFCCTHLSLTKEDRLASVSIIDSALREFSKGCRKSVYIAGDWNDTPDSEVLSLLKERFTILSDTATFTFPAVRPTRTIDYIAVWNGAGTGMRPKLSAASVPADSLASDHRPVVVRISSR